KTMSESVPEPHHTTCLLASLLDDAPVHFFYKDGKFQKTTNNKKQFLRLPASGNSSQKALKTEIQGINAMQVANA
ncbi:hypothetical protein STEG23_024014, partial [Scotinomys teguina]